MTPPDPAPGPCSAGPLTNVPLIPRESDSAREDHTTDEQEQSRRELAGATV
jgi:hypothetical protein